MELDNILPKLHLQDKILDKTILWMIPHNWKPNHFTIVRFLLTPLVAWLIMSNQFYTGLILFLIAAFTDAIDGALARTRRQITEWGKIYDPVADKLLIGSIAFLLIDEYLSTYLAFAIVIVEILLIVNGGIRKNQGKIVQANIWGKVKMMLQVLGVSFIFISILATTPIFITMSWFVLVVAIFIGMISLFTYSI